MLLTAPTEVFGMRFGDEKGVKLLCEAGYDALDYSMFLMSKPDFILNQPSYLSHVKEVKKIADSYGVPFVQAHSPFPSNIEDNEEYNKTVFDRIVRSIEIAGILGAGIIVVHPVVVKEQAAKKPANMDFYGKLQPYAKEYGVKVALENMWGWDDVAKRPCPILCSTGEEFADYLDSLDSRYFTACLDLGHCGIVGEDAANMIRVLGHDRLQALHVHDNDNFNDSHTAPYYGKMDWNAITAALKEIDYNGNFTFEADEFYAGVPNELLPDAALYLQKIGRHLIGKIS